MYSNCSRLNNFMFKYLKKNMLEYKKNIASFFENNLYYYYISQIKVENYVETFTVIILTY